MEIRKPIAIVANQMGSQVTRWNLNFLPNNFWKYEKRKEIVVFGLTKLKVAVLLWFADSKSSCFLENTSIDGDLTLNGIIDVDNASKCQELCQKDPSCEYFTMEVRVCYLMKNKHDSERYDGATSGSKRCWHLHHEPEGKYFAMPGTEHMYHHKSKIQTHTINGDLGQK